MQNFMNPYNPMSPQQQRLMQIEQQQFYPQMPQHQKGFSIIPVTNQQEAHAAQIDILNGTPSFFYNQNAGEIYLKQINQYGKADFIKFAKADEPISNENETSDVNTYEENFKTLNDKIDGLETTIKSLLSKNEENVNKGGSKNAK